MKSVLFSLLILLAMPAGATSGAWSRQSSGGVVSVGKQLLIGRTLQSPTGVPSTALMHQFSWRITLLSPPPPGLEIKLCSNDKCFLLPALSGQLAVKGRISAFGDFRFIYSVNSIGQLRPPLNVVSNQLTINYHQTR